MHARLQAMMAAWPLLFIATYVTLYTSSFTTVLRWAASQAQDLPISFSSAALTSRVLHKSPAYNYDYNSVLNDGLDQRIFSRLGQYAVRYTESQSNLAPPLGCSVTVVNTLERHGARLFTSGAVESVTATLDKVQASIADVSDDSLPSELRFLRNASVLPETSSLVPFGALQAYYSGKSTAEVYPSLSDVPPFIRASGDQDVDDDRVILTAKYWTLGFTGGSFPSANLTNADDVRQAAQALVPPNITLSEMPGQNNTLDVSTCPAAEAIPDAEGESGAQAAFAESTIRPTVGARLQSRLASAGAARINLTGVDLINLAELCSFDTLSRAYVTNAKLSLTQSGFCSMFNQTEWDILGYAFDVGKWVGAGYGNPYYRALATGYLRELTARLSGRLPPVQPPTSLNASYDSDPEHFPLPDDALVYFDGSHDNNMGPIAAALGLFAGPNLTTGPHAERRPHNWIFSRIAPLQGKIVFEKLSCGLPLIKHRQDFIRIRANEDILRGWCNDDGRQYASGTLCPLSTFLEQLAFAQDDEEWNRCYD